jgi:hypothetical protein
MRIGADKDVSLTKQTKENKRQKGNESLLVVLSCCPYLVLIWQPSPVILRFRVVSHSQEPLLCLFSLLSSSLSFLFLLCLSTDSSSARPHLSSILLPFGSNPLFPCHRLDSALSAHPSYIRTQTDMNRQDTAPLLANEDPRDSFDEQDRELLKQDARKQITRVK